MKLGNKLRSLREQRDKTLAEIASDSGLSVSYLSALERGRAAPSPRTLVALANVYHLPVVGLLADVDFDGEEWVIENVRTVTLSDSFSSLSERDKRLMRLLIESAQSYFEHVRYNLDERTEEAKHALAIAKWEHPELFESEAQP